MLGNLQYKELRDPNGFLIIFERGDSNGARALLDQLTYNRAADFSNWRWTGVREQRGRVQEVVCRQRTAVH